MVDETAEFVVLRVRGGELVEQGSWVYAWVGPERAVFHVGATGLDPSGATRIDESTRRRDRPRRRARVAATP